MVDTKKLDALMEWMKQSAGEDLLALIVVDRDGLIISSAKREGIDENVLGAMSALVEPVLKRISKEFSSENFGTGTFDTDDYRLIFCEAGPKAIVVIVADALASIDQMFPYAYLCAEKVARLLDGRPVSPVVPRFERRGDVQVSEKELKRIV